MGVMSSEVYEAFVAAGAPKAQAKAAAEAIPVSHHLATKRDIIEIKAEVANEFKTLYRWLWVMAASIVTLVLALGRVVFQHLT